MRVPWRMTPLRPPPPPPPPRKGGAAWHFQNKSDKIWRIDLQDDHESCHPVGLRMTLKVLNMALAS